MTQMAEGRSGSEVESQAHMPSDVDQHRGLLGRFAEAASEFFARAPFFAFCVGVVAIWAPSYFVRGSASEVASDQVA